MTTPTEDSRPPMGRWPWPLPSCSDYTLWQNQGEELEHLCLIDKKTHARIKNRKGLYIEEIHGDLAKAASELLKPEIKTIAILVGSCTNTNMWPPTDTDGPGGAFAIAAALWRLGKKILIVTDEVNYPQVYPALQSSLVWALHQQATEEDDKNRLEVRNFNVKAHAKRTDARDMKDLFAEADHIINVGRPGRGKEGEYWSAGLTSTTLWQADFSLLFEWAAEVSVQPEQKKTTTTIGCLGNELGMGRVKEAVKEHIEDGEWLANEAPANFTIIATTANYGAYALTVMLTWAAYLSTEQQQQQEQQEQQALQLLQQQVEAVEMLLPQVWDQAAILTTLTKEAARCGVSTRRGAYICGLSSDEVWQTLTDICRPIRRHFAIKARTGHYEESAEAAFIPRDA